MTDELQIIDLQPGDGKAAVKGALIHHPIHRLAGRRH